MRRAWFIGLIFGAVQALAAERLSIAAAANLTYAVDALNEAFQRQAAEVTVNVTVGASGNLFAQIKNGAPFDVFLSADTDYPRQIAAAGLGDPATLRTFAVGRLVLWTTRTDLDVSDIGAVIRSDRVKKLAIAQPRTAPYGRAAEAVLASLALRDVAAPKLVIGESISQTAQFVETGNADAGFVALSLVLSTRLAQRGHWLEVPPTLHAAVPLDHACIVTQHGAANPAARRYIAFLSSAAAQQVLERFGYAVPSTRANR